MSNSLQPNGQKHTRLLCPPLFSMSQLFPSVQFSRLVVSDSATLRTAVRQASLSITISQSLLKLMSIEGVMPSNHLIPFSSCLQSFPVSGSFLMSQLFASGGQSIGVSASASVLPMNAQDWFLWGLTGLISFQSKRLSRVFSSTTVWKHQFFSTQPSLWFNSLQKEPQTLGGPWIISSGLSIYMNTKLPGDWISNIPVYKE